MAEISDITIKRTQDTLGKIIKKPVLTDKLLRKPPFKFLHDIIHAIIQTTGFLNGLYTDEELQSDTIKDRDAKIAFLQKAIDVLKIVTKQDIRARPSKVVAGVEADKTNEFLQLLAKAADRRLDATEAIELVKAGKVDTREPRKEAKPTKAAPAKGDSHKTNKAAKDAPPVTNKRVKNDAKPVAAKPTKQTGSQARVSKQDSKSSDETRKPKAKQPLQAAATEASSKVEQKTADAVKVPSEDEPAPQQPTQKRSAEKLPPKQPSVSHEQAPEKDSQQQDHAVVSNEKQKSAEATPAAEHVAATEAEKTAGQLNGSREKAKSVDQTAGPIEHRLVKQSSNDSDKSRKSSHDGGKVSRRNSNESDKPLARSSGKVEKTSETTDEAKPAEKAPNDKPKSSKSKKGDGKTEADKPAANKNATDKRADKQYTDHPMEMPSKNANDAARPSKPAVGALRSAVARPVSARPSAPRRRDRNMKQILHTENFVQDSSEQSKTVRNAVLPEFDEDENVVITNAIEDNLLQFGEPQEAPMPTDSADKQGHLVQQILETQTAILKADGSNDTAQEIDESIFNDRTKSIGRNTAELRKSIQKLSLYITPLGKMMEYFQEDVDAMQIELTMWQKAQAAAEAEIKEKQRQTEAQLEQHRYHLAEINNGIREHIEQINSTTMNIVQNEEKIAKFVFGL